MGLISLSAVFVVHKGRLDRLKENHKQTSLDFRKKGKKDGASLFF